MQPNKNYSENMVLSIKDWRQALRAPPAYRVGNSTLRIQTKFMSIIVLSGLLILLIFYILPFDSYENKGSTSLAGVTSRYIPYNHTYPLSPPIISNQMRTFRIGLIADLDTQSKSKTESNTWVSYYKKGYLSYADGSIVVTWDNKDDIILKSNFAVKDRGMELSELLVFNGRLLTFDDRSGIIYEIVNDQAYPWVILMDGDGRSTKGFKSEWATVKDRSLFVGSMGKEWTTELGEFINHNPQYVKVISTTGEVQHLSWINEYQTVRKTMGINWPGYMIHESCVWSDVHNRWFFLPRRCSKEVYNETRDESMGCNVLISVDEHFNNPRVVKVLKLEPTHGFSSFKFIPTTDDKAIVALKSEEYNGKTATYITAFTINGKELLPETFVSDLKFEGIEFI